MQFHIFSHKTSGSPNSIFCRNPQKDIQAIGRVHRIGQTRVTHIYRFVTAGSVEERILQRQQQKLYLDSCVIRGSTAIAQAIDAQQLVEGDGETLEEDSEPVFKPSAVMEVMYPKLGDGMCLSDAPLRLLNSVGTLFSLQTRPQMAHATSLSRRLMH